MSCCHIVRALLLTVCAGLSPAWAGISVTVSPVGQPSSYQVTQDPKDGRWTVVVNLGNQFSFLLYYNVTVRATSSGESIALLQVNANPNSQAVANLVVEGQNGNPYLVDLDELSTSGSLGSVYVLLDQLDLQGDLGNVTIAGDVGIGGDIVVAGNLVGDILLTNGDEASGRLDNLTVDGDLLGNIAAVSIGSITVVGDIGVQYNEQTEPPTVSISSASSIDLISARSILAEIQAGTDVGRIETSGGGSQNGIFKGSAMCDGFSGALHATPGMYVFANLKGDVGLIDPLTAPIYIGQSLTSDSTISLPGGGLVDQIIINQRDVGGTWAGDIAVGNTMLAAPYSATADSLGGGAVGDSPFTLHGSSCEPQDDATVYIRYMDLGSSNICDEAPVSAARVQLYGPMILSGLAPHFEVLVWNGSAFVDAGYTVLADYAEGSAFRAALIELDGVSEWPAGQYRIKPLEGKVLCRNVSTTPDVGAFEYDFELVDNCEALLLGMFDLSNDNWLCGQDIACWASNPIDFDDSGAADTTDLGYLYDAISMFVGD